MVRARAVHPRVAGDLAFQRSSDPGAPHLPQGPSTLRSGGRRRFDAVRVRHRHVTNSRRDAVVAGRHQEMPGGSYTTLLFEGGVRRIAQKVGEEGVETALAAVAQDDEDLLGESADLVYHLLVLLRSRGLGLADVERVLRRRQGS